MICTTKTKSLLSHLQNASRYAGGFMSKVPALSGILLEVTGSSLKIKATSVNDFYSSSVPCTFSEEGIALVDGKKMTEFLSLVTDDEVKLEKKETSCIVYTSKGTGVFNCYPETEFPEFPLEPVEYSTLDTHILEMIPLALFSASKEESRPILTGVYMDTSSEGLKMVSTDGFRLSVVSVSKDVFPFPSSILSSRVLTDTIAVLKESEKIQIGFNTEDKIFSFKTEDCTIQMRTIEGDFPAYGKVVPSSSQTVVEMDRQDLIRNLKLCGIFARDYSNIVIFEVLKDGLKIRSKFSGDTNSVQTQEYVSFEGEELKVAFNYRFVLEFLQLIQSETVRISLGSSMSPCLFAPTDALKETFLHVIMPLRTDEVL